MKKRILLTFGCILLTLVIVTVGYLGMTQLQKYQANQKQIKEIQAHYSNWVSIEKGNLFCKKDQSFEKCGSIENLVVPLEETTVQSPHHQYFQIKDTAYYLLYTEVTPVTREEEPIPDYIPWNQNVHTKEITNLYQEGKQVLSIAQEIEVPIFYQDTTYYYVKYFNQIMALAKEENLEIIDHLNSEEVVASQIPVLYYDDITTWKDTENWKEQLESLKSQGFYSISLSDYEAWYRGNIQVREHAIVLLSASEEEIEGYHFYKKEDASISLFPANAVSEVGKPYYYAVTSQTTKEQFMLMLAKESVLTSSQNQKVAVLNYHFFYNPDTNEACNENICLATRKFEEQLAYLKNNGYYTLTMEEFRDWMYGKIDIPEKSVLLTVDDGAQGTGRHNGDKLIPLLEKYDLHATLFLITGWWDIENYRSPNLEIESHTYDMHTMYPSGAQMLISSNEHVINDLNQSIAITKSKKAFCFPFYAYNETAINQVKQVGFELSFVGGNYKASRKNDKYKIPRYPIYKGITMEQFIDMIS